MGPHVHQHRLLAHVNLSTYGHRTSKPHVFLGGGAMRPLLRHLWVGVAATAMIVLGCGAKEYTYFG